MTAGRRSFARGGNSIVLAKRKRVHKIVTLFGYPKCGAYKLMAVTICIDSGGDSAEQTQAAQFCARQKSKRETLEAACSEGV